MVTYIAQEQGQTTHSGKNFKSAERLSLCPFVPTSLKISWKSNFMNSFNYIYVYGPGTGADNPLETIFLFQQKGLIILPIRWRFLKILFEFSLYIYIFFHALKHVYSPRAVAHNNTLGSLFIYINIIHAHLLKDSSIKLLSNIFLERIMIFFHIKAYRIKFDLSVKKSRSTQGHHLN